MDTTIVPIPDPPARSGKWPFGGSGGDPLPIASAAVFLAAAILRLISIFNDFWLDEIWSWNLSLLVSSPVEILTKLTHDNNHPLNTFFLWALGDLRPREWYRFLSLATGVSSVGIMGIIGRRYGRTESFAALVLGGFSYFLIHYSSEARGYAPAVFFALAGFLVVEETLSGKGWFYPVLFWLTVLLGLLSHSTYIFPYSGMFAWSALHHVKRGDRAWQIVSGMLKTHGIPLALLAAHILWLSTVAVGGGPEYSVWDVIPETVLLAFGMPENRPLSIFACTAAAALFLSELSAMRRDFPDQRIFYLAAILIVPALVLVTAKPAVLFPRYFLVSVPFFLLLLARWLARTARRGTPGKVFCATLLVLYCSCNMFRFGDLVRYGRGGYSMALNSIVRQTEGGTVAIGSDHDFRNRMIVEYYSRSLPPAKRVVYVPGAGIRPEAAPEWLIVHRIGVAPPSPPAPLFLLPNGRAYALNGVFPSPTPSGFWWYLYRMAN